MSVQVLIRLDEAVVEEINAIVEEWSKKKPGGRNLTAEDLMRGWILGGLNEWKFGDHIADG